MTELYSLINGLEEEEIRYVKIALKKNENVRDETFLLQKLFDFSLIYKNSPGSLDKVLLTKIYPVYPG
jgi:hypothetical protein